MQFTGEDIIIVGHLPTRSTINEASTEPSKPPKRNADEKKLELKANCDSLALKRLLRPGNVYGVASCELANAHHANIISATCILWNLPYGTSSSAFETVMDFVCGAICPGG